MKKLLIFVMLLPLAAHSAEWTLIDRHLDDWVGHAPGRATGPMHYHHSNISLYYDSSSVVIDGVSRRAWWKQNASSADGELMDQMILTTFDCHNHKMRTEKSGTRDRLTDSYEYLPVNGESYDIEPDTLWEQVFNAVCKK